MHSSYNNISEEKLLLILAISSISFLSYKEKQLIEDKLDNVGQLSSLSIDDVFSIINRVAPRAKWQGSEYEKYAKRSYALLKAFDIKIIKHNDPNFPYLLKEIYDTPYVLFYRGNIKCLYEDCVAIVGTRRPTQKAMEATYYLARDLAQVNKTIVSGLALGIDTFAHKGSLSAENGKTVAILPCGLDVIYPSTNKKLASQIIQRDGCLISEYPPGEEPLKWHFLARNRIISGLSRATIVMEAPVKSGSLITADYAIEQNRDLLFHKVAKDFDESDFGKRLNQQKREKKTGYSSINYINDGAVVVENAQDVIQYIG